jgi:hypothetical protein
MRIQGADKLVEWAQFGNAWWDLGTFAELPVLKEFWQLAL